MAKVTDEVIINTEVENADKSIKQLEEVADATNDAQKAAEDYTDELKDGAAEVEVMGVSLNGLKGAFNSSIGVIGKAVKSFGGLKTAMLAVPIFALIAAITGLIGFLTKTQKGLDFLSKAMKVIEEVMAELIDRAISFGKALVNIFTLDFKAFKKNSTDAFGGLADSMTDAYNAGILLADQLKALEEGTAINSIAIARYTKEIEKQKLISEDVDQDINDRIKAQKEAQKATERILELQTESLELEEEILITEAQKYLQRNKGEGLSTDLINKSAELQVRQLEAEGEAFARRVEQQNALRGLEAEKRAQDETDLITYVEASAQRATIDQAEELNKVVIDNTTTAAKIKNLEDLQKAKEAEANTARVLAEETAALERSLFEGTYANIVEILGSETALGKAMAVAQATFNTYEAVTVALTAKTMVGRILGVTFALTTGLAAVKTILGTPIPKVEVVSTPFARGGMINGRSHAGGGVHIEAEGGEAIINKRSMAIPWVRAQASRLNEVGGGVKFARGGLIPDSNALAFLNLEKAVQSVRPILVTEDLNRVQASTFVTNEISTL